jgi:hypothetical protein
MIFRSPENPDYDIFDWNIDDEYFAKGDLRFFYKHTLPVLRKYRERSITWKELESGKRKYAQCHGSRGKVS